MLIASLLILTGCTASPKKQYAGTCEVVLPMPEPVDPPDAEVRKAVTRWLAKSGAPAFSSYEISRYDLNNDGRREALVLFKTPYGYWCNIHGCPLLVLEAHDEHFTFKSKVQPVRAPIYVSETTNNGWKDIIIHVSGRWKRTKDVALQFNGSHYPQNPERLPGSVRYALNEEVRLFYD